MYSFSLPIFFLDLFITICGYLLIPAILCILRKELTLSQIKRIAIVNGICVCFIFIFLCIEITGKGSAGGALLWPYVSYSMMKKFCLKKSDDIRPVNKQAKPEAPNSVEDVRFSLSYEGEKRTLGGSYRFDGKDFRVKTEQDIAPITETAPAMTTTNKTVSADIQPVKKYVHRLKKLKKLPSKKIRNRKKHNYTVKDENTEIISDVKRILPFFLILLLVLSIICNINQFVKIEELEKESKFVSYQLYTKAEFLDENIVFVIEGYGNYFYTYDEMISVVGDRQFSYWAFNKEQAIALGYIAAYSH